MYSRYERVWHWLMGLSVMLLMLTGLQIHFAGRFELFPFPVAVTIHNAFASIMVINAFLAMFYHLATGAIRQFLPKREGLKDRTVEQLRFYSWGIFVGAPHPPKNAADRKLNPLQQATYLILLNVLFPFQVITGTMIAAATNSEGFASAIGGLTCVTPLHNLGSWLFISFFVMHLYLTTTGHTVFSNVKAMISGWEEVEEKPVAKV